MHYTDNGTTSTGGMAALTEEEAKRALVHELQSGRLKRVLYSVEAAEHCEIFKMTPATAHVYTLDTLGEKVKNYDQTGTSSAPRFYTEPGWTSNTQTLCLSTTSMSLTCTCSGGRVYTSCTSCAGYGRSGLCQACRGSGSVSRKCARCSGTGTYTITSSRMRKIFRKLKTTSRVVAWESAELEVDPLELHFRDVTPDYEEVVKGAGPGQLPVGLLGTASDASGNHLAKLGHNFTVLRQRHTIRKMNITEVRARFQKGTKKMVVFTFWVYGDKQDKVYTKGYPKSCSIM